MSKLIDFSDTTQHNMSFSFTTSPIVPNQKNKKRFFEVFHKKEMLYLNQDSMSNSEDGKSTIVQYKCVYCGNKYENMNRFEAHMRIHVRKYFI